MSNFTRSRGLTLVELMVVIAILAILAAMGVAMFKRTTGRYVSTKIQNRSTHQNNSAYLPIENPSDENKQTIVKAFEEENHVTVTSSKYYIKVEYIERNQPGK